MIKDKKMISVEKAQDMRSAGYYVLMSYNLKKVIAVSLDRDKIFNIYKNATHKTKFFEPLKKVIVTSEQIKKYEIIQEKIMREIAI